MIRHARRFAAFFVGINGLILVMLAPTGATGSQSPSSVTEESRPNIVVFLADDLGWGDLGCYGNPTIKTPNLDAFARQGMRFTQCYAACGVCSPSRSAILTGRTPYRNGVWHLDSGGKRRPSPDERSHAGRVAQGRGYATCHVGKWHLNGTLQLAEASAAERPRLRLLAGDAEQCRAEPQGPGQLRPQRQAGRHAQGLLRPVDRGRGDRVAPTHREPGKPFYLNVWTHEPHLPIETDPRFMAEYPGMSDVGLRQHHGNITQLDWAFGTSDGGPRRVGARRNTRSSSSRRTTGPKGVESRTASIPGHRATGTGARPAACAAASATVTKGESASPASSAGRVTSGRARLSDVPVIGTDIFTTVCAIVGIPVPSDRTIDGADMRPAFEGKPIPRSRPLYWRTHIAAPSCRAALRIGDWKIVADEDLTRFELYNLASDPHETSDLSAKNPEMLAKLKEALIRMDAEVKAEGPDWWKRERSER